MIKKIDQFWKYQKSTKKNTEKFWRLQFFLENLFYDWIQIGEGKKWDVRVTKIQVNVVESGFTRRSVSRFF